MQAEPEEPEECPDGEEREGAAPDRGWACDAYDESVRSGCFFEKVSTSCLHHAQCAARLRLERQRVFRAIQELAAAGDAMYVDIATHIVSPQMLLNSAQPPRT